MWRSFLFALGVTVLFIFLGLLIGSGLHEVSLTALLTAKPMLWIGGIASAFIGLIMLAAYFENRQWNGGVCKHCRTSWRHFDTDSQGGRGYQCQSGQHSVWISYPVDSTAS